MPLDADIRQIIDLLSPPGAPDLPDLGLEQARAFSNARVNLMGPPEPVGRVENREIPGPAGPIGLRIYQPAGSGPWPVVVFFHGGGWVLCSLDTHDGTCRRLCNLTEAVVVSVDYRLAPEHRFPVPLEDCYAAACWVAAHGDEIGADGSRMAVAGDSAGGNLAAATALLTLSRRGPALRHQLLVYPVTDHTMDSESYRENATGYFLTGRAMAWFWEQYLGNPAYGTDPLASPLRATQLAGLPPATVITAEFDPLRDEGEAYGHRLAAAGVPCRVERFAGVIHGFFSMQDVLEKARLATELAAQALRDALR